MVEQVDPVVANLAPGLGRVDLGQVGVIGSVATDLVAVVVEIGYLLPGHIEACRAEQRTVEVERRVHVVAGEDRAGSVRCGPAVVEGERDDRLRGGPSAGHGQQRESRREDRGEDNGDHHDVHVVSPEPVLKLVFHNIIPPSERAWILFLNFS